MRYNININQKAIIELAPEFDLAQCAIIGYLHDLCASKNKAIVKQRLADKDGEWTWVDYTHLINEMPLMRITSKSGITPKIKAIEQAGFIELKHWERQRLYVRLTELMDAVFTQVNTGVHSSEHSSIYINNNKNNHNTRNSSRATSSNISTVKPELKFDYDEYIKDMKKNNQRHIALIGQYLEKRGIRFDTKPKVQAAIKRHLRAAKKLEPFENKEIRRAARICEDKYGDIDWTLDTVLKVLTSSNINAPTQSEEFRSKTIA